MPGSRPAFFPVGQRLCPWSLPGSDSVCGGPWPSRKFALQANHKAPGRGWQIRQLHVPHSPLLLCTPHTSFDQVPWLLCAGPRCSLPLTVRVSLTLTRVLHLASVGLVRNRAEKQAFTGALWLPFRSNWLPCAPSEGVSFMIFSPNLVNFASEAENKEEIIFHSASVIGLLCSFLTRYWRFFIRNEVFLKFILLIHICSTFIVRHWHMYIIQCKFFKILGLIRNGVFLSRTF